MFLIDRSLKNESPQKQKPLLFICDAVQAVSVDLLELLHVGGVHPQLLQQLPRLLQHAGPVHQAGQRDPALQVNVVIKLRNVITCLLC